MYIGVSLIVWSLLVWSYTLTSENEDWDRLLTEMTILCPNVDFCGYTQSPLGPAGPDVQTVPNSCCIGCSCASNCSESRGCCNGEGDTDALSECLKPSTKQELEMNTYYFINKPPPEGCRQYKSKSQGQEGNVTCSSGEMDAPWGNFLPVYSRSLDKNFKNAACARSHGADDVEEWKSVIYIDFASDFVGSLADFYENNLLVNDYVVFNPPNMDSKTFEKLCFKQSDSCPGDILKTFFIPPNLNLDRESIVKACKQGPVAKYLWKPGEVFKNVFCALCNGLWEENLESLGCVDTLYGIRHANPPIRVFIDPKYMATLELGTAFMKDLDVDCYRPKHLKDEVVCEKLHCPALQTRLKSGKCGFVAKFALIDNLILCLNVSVDNGPVEIDITKNAKSSTQTRSMFEENSPWSKQWLILSISARQGERPMWSEFLVCLALGTKQINLESLNNEIHSSLSKNWMINLDKPTPFEQRITKHGRTITNRLYGDVTAEWPLYQSDYTDNLAQPIWKNLYDANLRLYSSLYYDRMYMCEQIELRPEEYRLRVPGDVMLLTKLERFLYPNEYTVLMNGDGSWRVRVCLESSGYAKVVSGTGTMYFLTALTVAPVFGFIILYELNY